MELFKAHQQWKSRPSDERFPTIQSLYDATLAYANTACEAKVVNGDVRVEVVDGEVQLVGKKGTPAHLTHWAFGQLANRVGAPASYMRELPATLAAQNLNHGLKELPADEEANLLLHRNGSLMLRAVTSDKYSRIWNHEVAARLLDMEARGWQPAVPDIRRFDEGNDTALYCSDHDMFAFVRFSERTIAEPGSTSGMWRGVIVENSEVGAGSLRATRFLYREMCGNHIIWGASKVSEVAFRHVGTVRDRFQQFAVTARQWSDESASIEEGMIQRAMETRIGATKEQVLDALFGKRAQLGLSRKAIEAGYDAVQPEDGDARTAWGIVQGLTRHSQTTPYADERNAIDKSAGKILQINF